MFDSRDDSVLQLHLPEGWPNTVRPNAEFRYARLAGGTSATGVGPLAAIPRAKTTIVVAPAGAVLFARLRLPKVRGSKLMRLLPVAVEDLIATAPEDVHVVLVEHAPGDASLVAVVGRQWLAATLAELASHHLTPASLIVEAELAMQLADAESTRRWVVVRTPSGGFACLGRNDIIALDLGADTSELPMALRIARNTHRREGETPAEILVFVAPETKPPDLDAWGRALDVPVRSGGNWEPERMDARGRRATDLLRGDFRRYWGTRELGRSVKLAGVAATIILGLHAMLTVGDWWRLTSEARQLRTQMETEFRQVFPEAQAVVDAPLQMRRSLGRLRREARIPDASDVVPLLSALGPSLVSAGAHAERARYERGELEIEVTLPASEDVEAFQRRLATPGYRIRLERIGSASNGRVAVLRVMAEA